MILRDQPVINPPLVIAHRGASAYAPENTLAAVCKAHALGLVWVEFDVMLAKCGEAVIMHDERLSRTTNAKGKVVEHTYAEIAQLDAGRWFGPQYAGERVPTLAAMLAGLKELGLKAVIEIKPAVGLESKTVAKVMTVLEQHGFKRSEFIIASFSAAVLREVRAHDATVALGLGIYRWRKDWQAISAKLACFSLHVSQRILTTKRAAAIKAQGYHLLSYTVNTPRRAQKLFEWGVDGVFSDCPDRIL